MAEGYAIDATRMAEELGNERAANVVLIGALSTALGFAAADWETALAEFVPKKTIAVNLEAFRQGRSWIEEARTAPPDTEAPPAAWRDRSPRRIEVVRKRAVSRPTRSATVPSASMRNSTWRMANS